MLQIDELVLFPTWHCDIACRHCLFWSSPRLKGQLPLPLAQDLISQAARDLGAQRLVLSGGEVFGDPDYLVALARCARDHGLAFRALTNGSFANRPEARALLAELRALGMHSLTISWDAYHQEFIDAGTIRTLISLCRSQDIEPLLSAIVSRSHRLQDALDALGSAAHGLHCIQFPCLPIGRAQSKVAPESLLPVRPEDVDRPCAGAFRSLTVIHDGQVFPCSAVGGFSKGLALGNAHDERLLTLARKRARHPHWTLLSACGPGGLLAQMQPDDWAAAGLNPEQREHDCVSCHRLHESGLAATLVDRHRRQRDRDLETLLGKQGWPALPDTATCPQPAAQQQK